MKSILFAYNRLIYGLAFAAAVAIIAAGLLVAVDVFLRNIGASPLQPTAALVEYALLFSTMMGAPWLVRLKAHITVGSFVQRLPEPLERLMGVFVHILSIAVLTLLGFRAAVIGIQKFGSGAMDIRSIAIPSWCAYAILSVGFLLMATEFLRHLVRKDTGTGESSGH